MGKEILAFESIDDEKVRKARLEIKGKFESGEIEDWDEHYYKGQGREPDSSDEPYHTFSRIEKDNTLTASEHPEWNKKYEKESSGHALKYGAVLGAVGGALLEESVFSSGMSVAVAAPLTALYGFVSNKIYDESLTKYLDHDSFENIRILKKYEQKRNGDYRQYNPKKPVFASAFLTASLMAGAALYYSEELSEPLIKGHDSIESQVDQYRHN